MTSGDLQLPICPPNRARSEQVRARCHRALRRRAVQRERAARRAQSSGRVLEPALLGAFSVVYLVGVLFDALRLISR